VNWGETARTALDAIRARRMRSALTMLGILIGIAAVMLTVGLGQGASAQVKAQISSLGSNLLIVSPGSSTTTGGIRGGRGSASTLTARDAAALGDRTTAPDIAAVAPVSSSETSLVNGSTNWTTSVVGTTPSWLDVRARSMAEGRFFTQAELDSSSPVVVLGATTASELFTVGSPVGQSITINGSTFTVIGVLNTVGASTTSDEDDQAVMPETAYTSRVATGSSPGALGTIYLEATSQNTLSAAYQEADATLSALHGITATSTADFTINSQQSLLATVTSTSKTLTVLLGGIAAVSLLVGGIGVMNIMLVSVTERIREIGLRKALGATPRVIRRQFLVEASMLGFAGGVAGLVIGAVGSRALEHFLSQPVTISGTAAAGALVVALVIGIVAGVYPAGRAARLAPIEALRSE
jgi:putative ABC transport system permease protein